MNNLGKKLTVALFLCFGIVSAFPGSPARAVTKGDQPPTAGLAVQVSGLVAGKLVVVLNGQEELAVNGNGTFKFKSELAGGAPFKVTVKEPPLNHRCELGEAAGSIAGGKVSTVKAVCRETGRWSDSALLADAITPAAQDNELAAAIDGRANGLVVWSQSVGGTRRILKKEYREGKWLTGSEVSDAISPEGTKAGKSKVAVADNGDAVVVWEQADQDSSRILLAERRHGVWNLPKSPADSLSIGAKYAWEAEVAMNGVGETVVVWSQESASGLHAIYKSEYRHGKWQHPRGLDDFISPDQGGDAVRPKVAISDNGAVVVVWEQDVNGVNRIFKSECRDMKWKHPRNWDDYVSLKGEGDRGAYLPMVAIDDAGNALIAWKQAFANRERIYLSEYRGGVWRHPRSPEDAISPPEFISAALNDLSMDGKGNALILWTEYRERRQSMYKSEFRQGKWRHPAEGEALVSAPPGAWEFYVSGHSVMAADGKAVAAWLQRNEDKMTRAYLAEYDNGKWYLPGMLLNIQEQPAAGLALAASAKGNVIAAWTQSDGDSTRLYSRVFRVAEESTPAKPGKKR